MPRRRALQLIGAAGAAAAGFPAPAIAQVREPMAQFALGFLADLYDKQRPYTQYPFDDPARFDWHYTPRRRPGLAIKEMSGDQRDATWRLLRAALSKRGFSKAELVLRLEEILGKMTGNPSFRDPENYAMAIFGDPAGDGPWGWRFEGHHLSLSVTIVPGEGIALTPMFFGANPAKVPAGHDHAGLRLLGDEEDLAFDLIGGLEGSDRDRAVIADRSLRDIVTGPGREKSLREPAGLPAADMNEARRDGLLRLLRAYLANARPVLAKAEYAKIGDAGFERLHFAWAGSLSRGAPHYYRIHGPSVIIEYDNTQNGANHAHSVWHDPTNLFGEDLLRRHHERDHG
jgi:hypothetical protein